MWVGEPGCTGLSRRERERWAEREKGSLGGFSLFHFISFPSFPCISLIVFLAISLIHLFGLYKKALGAFIHYFFEKFSVAILCCYKI